MSTPHYPFAAIARQHLLKKVLLLAAVDQRLSVLLKGDKGSGKTTAVRGLAEILPAGAPFVNLPISATEDRLLGGLDLDRALRGEAGLKPGLIHGAHGGVLYVDEINLLPDFLTDALLDVVSSGVHHVERDGFSVTADSRFVLIGSMNLEEGALRPQLLDRFAMSLDVEAPLAADERALIIDRRIRFDSDPAAFRSEFEGQQDRLRRMIAQSRAIAREISASEEILRGIAEAVSNAGVKSLRADLAILRAAGAHAALEERREISPDDVRAVLPLVLHHRTKRSTPDLPMKSGSNCEGNGTKESQNESGHGTKEFVFPSEVRLAPELRSKLRESVTPGRGLNAEYDEHGNDSQPHGSLNVAASFIHAFRNTGEAALRRDQLIFRDETSSATRFIFVIDASGSHAAQQRMRAVKGIAVGLLQSSVDRKDEVAVIAFRGAKAEIILPPCRDSQSAIRALEFLPTGGRTPLAHGLDLATTLATPGSVLVLVTDGRANVPLATSDPWQDALDTAGKLSCAALLVDSSVDGAASSNLEILASALRAKLVHIDELTEKTLLTIRST